MYLCVPIECEHIMHIRLEYTCLGGAIAGGVIGGIVGVATVIVICIVVYYWFFIYKKKKGMQYIYICT